MPSLEEGYSIKHGIEAAGFCPAYVDVAVTRWQNYTGQTSTLEATGEAFETKSVG